MWISKIGNKCASFINHKFFHPGNQKNLEKVWLAEEKEKKQKEEEESHMKKKKEKLQLHTLKKLIKKNEEKHIKEDLKLNDGDELTVDKIQKKKKLNHGKGKIEETVEEAVEEAVEEKKIVQSKYDEDIFMNSHTTVYGSYYDKENDAWGYRCCKSTDKNSICINSKEIKKDTHEQCDGKKKTNKNKAKSVKKDVNKKKKQRRKKITVDNSITAVLNRI